MKTPPSFHIPSNVDRGLVTMKKLRMARIGMLQAIASGNEDEAYYCTRWLCHMSMNYLLQNAHKILPNV